MVRLLALLGRVSIRLRIAALVALAVCGAVAFGIVYAVAANRTDRALVAQDGFQRLNDLATRAQAGALALQVQAEQFLRERDPRFAAAFRGDATRLAEVLDELAAVPEGAPMAETVTALSEGARAAIAEFAALEAEAGRLGLGEDDGLRGRLRGSVGAIEDELKMWPNAAPLMVDMLQMRQAEKNFMLTGDSRYLGLHVRHANQFDFALDTTTLAPSTREDFRKLLTAYAADMKAYGAGSIALAAEVDRLRARQASLRPLVEQVAGFARDGAATAIVEQRSVRRGSLVLTTVIGVVGLVMFTAAGLLIALSIVLPLRQIETAMKSLAGGDHSVVVPCAERGDEIGDMAKAVLVFKKNAEAVARMQVEHEMVRREAEAASRGHVLTLAERFESAVKSVAALVSDTAVTIHETAGGIAGGGRDGRDAWSLTVAEAAAKAGHTVAAVTEATEQLSASVSDIAGHGRAVAQVAGTAMAELVTVEDRVHGLAEIAGRIDAIVGLIGDVAQRTNMLSLNAAIEAQRAGEAGKGFAVVAGEVKRLACQTAESTREIAGQIAAIQAATEDTVCAIAGIGGAIRAMDDLARVVQDSVARQGEVTRAIERCVADVQAETTILREGVTAFTHSAAQQCGAAARVLWAAEDLAAPTRTLKDEVDGFLQTIRAGAIVAA